MKIAFFEAKDYDVKYFSQYNNNRHEITFFEEALTVQTIQKVQGFDAISTFHNTDGNEELFENLHKLGVKFWLQRSMGYGNVNIKAANKFGIKVFRVLSYAPESVAEMALALLMGLNRHLVKTTKAVKQYNFSTNGLLALSISGSTIGVIGAGKIGQSFIKVVKAMGAKVLVSDPMLEEQSPQLSNQLGFEFVSLNQLMSQSHFIIVCAGLNASSKHILNQESLSLAKNSAFVVNIGRGELVDTKAMLKTLKNKQIAGFATDVLEGEEGRFYEDLSAYKQTLEQEDSTWKELIQMDNVLITPHYGFLTTLALSQITQATLNNADAAQQGDFTYALEVLENGKVKNG
ncbi:D-lactate dehydrogenase [Mycoplasmopsis citelli]|uniref:D-lactate dehydrogenase n=1 Tax=Mycoplasmopsis citelli TaxID=171281 RepID=A0A449B1G9_9BACT|nr:NAD(P)-dependent oxidoreductase [Mycoplasmopsis citelli]VEU74450.1 D-lactate dehydrogenase [Mycoplasmopsis citelli]